MRFIVAIIFGVCLLCSASLKANDDRCVKKFKACGAACQKVSLETHKETKLGCQSKCSLGYAACDVGSFLPGGSGLVSWLTAKSPKKKIASQCRENFKTCEKGCEDIVDGSSGETKLSCKTTCSGTYAACDFTDLLPGRNLVNWMVTPSAEQNLLSCEDSFKACGAECMKIETKSVIAGETTRLGCQTACSTKYASCDFKDMLPGREVFPWVGDKIGKVGSFFKDIARSKKEQK